MSSPLQQSKHKRFHELKEELFMALKDTLVPSDLKSLKQCEEELKNQIHEFLENEQAELLKSKELFAQYAYPDEQSHLEKVLNKVTAVHAYEDTAKAEDIFPITIEEAEFLEVIALRALENGKPEEAEILFRTLLQALPVYASGWAEIARCAENEGNLERAESILLMAIESIPGNDYLPVKLIQFYAKHDQIDKLREFVLKKKREVDSNPVDHETLHRYLKEVAQSLGL